MEQTKWDWAVGVIESHVETLNKTLGFDTGWENRVKVTFGYIGNLTPRHDDRLWSVFLPHPGRVGTENDRVGSVRTGDVDGLRELMRQLIAMNKTARMARNLCR